MRLIEDCDRKKKGYGMKRLLAEFPKKHRPLNCEASAAEDR